MRTHSKLKQKLIPLGADPDRRTVLAAMVAGAVLGPSGCGPGRAPTPPSETAGKVATTRRSAKTDRRPLLPGIEPTVRVRVAAFSAAKGAAVPAVTLGAAGQRLWVTTPELDRPGRVVDGPILISAARGGWSIASQGHRRSGREVIKSATPLAIASVDRGPIVWNKTPITGLLRVARRSDVAPGEFDLVTHLAMEAYLPGVLERELFASWPEATFEAQAIAARSFALCERDFWLSRRHYDVVASQSSQAWSGGEASDRARAAVRATTGHVLVWEERVVPAYYSAACGGVPASARDAIGPNPVNAIAPLTVASPTQRRPTGCCEASPYASWEVAFNRSDALRALVRYGKEHGRKDLQGLKALPSITVAARNPAGRPVSYTLLVDPSRSIELGAETLRRAINHGRVSDRLRASFAEYDVLPSSVTVGGHGFGHGVGLCQYGAKTMGTLGRSSTAILARYYPGATIEQAWETARPYGRYAGV